MLRRVLAPILALFCGLTPASANRSGVQDLHYGYFCALEPVATEEASGTVSGVILLVDSLPHFIARGPVVPAQIGVGFGVHVRVQPEFDGPVSIQVTHPPMGPTGATRETWNTTLSSEELRYTGFAFEHEYEMVTGTWTMSAQANGRMIYSVNFEVVPAITLPTVTCDPDIPLS